MVFVGIDWADHLHAFHVMDGSQKQHSGEFIQEPAVIDEQIAAWRNEFPDTILAVAIEQTRGALVTALLKYEAVEIFPVNPAALASYRKAFRHGGGKNDPTDAKLLAQYLQHYHQHLRPLRLDSPLTRELASLAVDRRRLVDQRVEFANQLQALLKQYFPAILQLKPAKIYAEFILRILLKYPTLAHLQKASTKSLTACF
jgi:transposase